MRTRPVDKSKFKDYLKRAEECVNAMNWSYGNKEWNACVIGAVQSAIASADAPCVFKTGSRHAGERHEDAVALFLGIDTNDMEIKNNSKRLSKLLSIKSDAEYGEKLMKQADADEAKITAERLFHFVKGRCTLS
ncbi:HEPN domain-containing protein [archaeon]|nr:MAG: HEPN domain-containing protein [archaeon]